MQDPTRHLLTRAITVVLAFPLAIAGLIACAYGYAVEDQAQYLVQLYALRNPALYPGDPYLEAFGPLGSLFWHLFRPLPQDADAATFLAIQIGITAINGVLLAMLVRPLLPVLPARASGRRIALALASLLPAALLVVPKELNWFGLVSLADRELTATFVAMPLVLGSVLALTRGRPVLSLAGALLTLPIHGQTGIFLCAAWVLATLIDRWHNRHQRLALLAFGATGAGLALWMTLRSRLPDAEHQAHRAIGDGLYPELIDPTSASLSSWGVVGALLLLGAVSAWQVRILLRPSMPVRASSAYAALLRWAACSLVLPSVGIALHAVGVREPFLEKLMVGRALMLPQLASIVLIAAWAAHALVRTDALRWSLATGALLLIAIWPLPGWPLIGAALSILALLLTVIRVTPSASVPGPDAAVRLAGVSLLVMGTLMVTSVRGPEYPWLRSAEDPQWLEVQHWAREHTPVEARFVTPPYLSGWRVGSLRTTVGEVKDGCLLFYTGAPAIRWATRMESLGQRSPYTFVEVDGFAGGGANHGPPPSLRELHESYANALPGAIEPSHDFIVVERLYDLDVGTVVFQNDRFVVRRLGADQASERNTARTGLASNPTSASGSAISSYRPGSTDASSSPSRIAIP